MTTLHQIWIGGELPEQERKWVSSMEKTASALGMGHRLDTWETASKKYADNPVMPILKKMLQVLPTATTYALISDWWRLRVLADEGGWYCDTDFSAQGMPAWKPDCDFCLFDNGTKKVTLANSMLVCNGERGRKAALILATAAENKLTTIMPKPDDDHFAETYIRTVRTDRLGDKKSLTAIMGNRFLRNEALRLLKRDGYSFGAIPQSVANNSNMVEREGKPAALWHMLTVSWINHDIYYWQDRLDEARRMDREAAKMKNQTE